MTYYNLNLTQIVSLFSTLSIQYTYLTHNGNDNDNDDKQVTEDETVVVVNIPTTTNTSSSSQPAANQENSAKLKVPTAEIKSRKRS